MTEVVFSAVTSFAIAFLILPVIIKYSLSKNLVDIPGRRKIHKKVTPTMGGIALFLGFMISTMIWIDLSDLKNLRYVIISLLIIFFVGARDDFMSLKPWMKLAAQIFVSCVLVAFFDLRIVSFYGILGIHALPHYIGDIVTIFTIIVIVNSFNLIDGLDGLAGSIASVTLLAYGIWFYLAGDQLYSILSFGLLGSLVAFLMFNWEPSEIFMGDSGALVVGLTISIITIHFINFNYSLPAENSYRFNGSVGTAVCFILVPLIDTLRVFIVRIIRGQSPFTPDKSHVHHSIMRLGFSHSQTTLLLAGLQLAFIIVALLLRQIDDNYFVAGIVLTGTVLSLALSKLVQGRVNA